MFGKKKKEEPLNEYEITYNFTDLDNTTGSHKVDHTLKFAARSEEEAVSDFLEIENKLNSSIYNTEIKEIKKSK